MKKRNLLKRNSGFIAATILAAGASFAASDMVLTELKPGSIQTGSGDAIVIVESEKNETENTTYETDPFTITASGTVMNQVESEALAQTEKNETDPESLQETGEQGEENISGQGNSQIDENGYVIEDTVENGSGAAGSSDGTGTVTDDNAAGSTETGTSSAEGTSGESSASAGASGDGSASSGTGTSGDSGSASGTDTSGSITILNPGGGYYTDSSSSGSSGGSSSGSSSSGSSVEILDQGGSSGNNFSGVSGSYENGIFSPDNLILWHINSRYISEEELWNYDAATIRYIRNEIFALHGRIFRSEDLMSYFSQKSWYVPTYDPDTFDANMESYLNDYEWANLQVILAYEELLYS